MVSAIKVLVFLKSKNTIILKIKKIKQIKQKETEILSLHESTSNSTDCSTKRKTLHISSPGLVVGVLEGLR